MEVKFKSRDVVVTPGGRLAKVLELLPGHRRLVEFQDPHGGKASFEVAALSLLHSAPVRPWREHTL